MFKIIETKIQVRRLRVKLSIFLGGYFDVFGDDFFFETKYNQLVDRSKNSSRKDGISHKIGDHKHQFRRKDLGGSNLLSRITANRGSLLSHHNHKIRIG